MSSNLGAEFNETLPPPYPGETNNEKANEAFNPQPPPGFIDCNFLYTSIKDNFQLY